MIAVLSSFRMDKVPTGPSGKRDVKETGSVNPPEYNEMVHVETTFKWSTSGLGERKTQKEKERAKMQPAEKEMEAISSTIHR